MGKIITELRNQIIDTIKGIDRTETETTHWIPLKDDGDKIWAIVFGYIYEDEKWYMKVAYKDKKNIMSEYNFDWIMPIDKDYNVVDSEIEMSENIGDVDCIIVCWSMYKNEFVGKEN